MRSLILSLLALPVLAATAFASDLPTHKDAPPMAPIIIPPTWTGFYIGVMGGYATGPSKATPDGFLADPVGAYPVGFDVDGGFVGGQIGYNYEFADHLVLGAVGDIAWADLSGKACSEVTKGRCSDNSATDSYAIGKVNWLSTIRVKAGFAVTPDALLYATGGVAFAGTRAEDTYIDGVNNVSADATHTGWAVGAGGEYKLTRQISFGLEYLYVDLGKETYTFDSSGLGGGLAGNTLAIDADVKLNIFKGSLNYHF